MDVLVSKFNGLPRPMLAEDGLPSHWVFGVRCCLPDQEVLLVVRPQSKDIIQGLPSHPSVIRSLPTPKDKAQAIITLLLKGFAEIGDLDIVRDPIEAGGTVPWSWASDTPDLIPAIENELRTLGVREDLCSIGVASDEHVQMLEDWVAEASSLRNSMLAQLPGAATRDTSLDPAQIGDSACHGCGVSQPWAGLKNCAACASAWYCSPACQKSSWKSHRSVCRATSKKAAVTHFTTEAHSNSAAQALARRINLILPTSPGRCNLAEPMRRLVLTGQDTSENFKLFFGTASQQLAKQHRQCRLQVLLEPVPGSQAHALLSPLDEDCPIRSPRPISEAEQREIDEVRMYQQILRQPGVVTAPNVFANINNKKYLLALDTMREIKM
ncbi:hypothetical protein LTR10_010727 [Elasticomyces elasticus]|nr:hypothetical protein LTR10_010727 [Elasticomyces elasticus]KAK4968333.1 hypothetical protein LTR42_009616 [Elasticomyces elasticus]